MKLLALGASGGCGRHAVRVAAQRGHYVRAVVRPETSFEAPAGVEVVRANVLDGNSIAGAAAGQDAVLSCLGPKRTNPSNPWSPLEPPPRFAEESGRLLIAALGEAEVRRLVVISAAGVGDSAHALPGVMRWLIAKSTIGKMYADLEKLEQICAASALDWLAVRPVTLVSAPLTRRAREVTRYRTHSIVGRADVARFMVAAVEDAAPFTRRTPMIGWW